MKIQDIGTTFKSALSQAAKFVTQPYVGMTQLKDEKPRALDQIRDPRFWDYAISGYGLTCASAMVVTGCVYLAQAAEPVIIKSLSVVAGEVGQAGAISGIIPIYNLDGSRASTEQLMNKTSRKAVLVRSVPYFTAKL